ncbi:Epididymis-Specific Alpha-Mannosidase [Manis pentadactyla]|nr:Epididymis-Specific Alpha-Mannosidase [Manis pentadactyla]
MEKCKCGYWGVSVKNPIPPREVPGSNRGPTVLPPTPQGPGSRIVSCFSFTGRTCFHPAGKSFSLELFSL